MLTLEFSKVIIRGSLRDFGVVICSVFLDTSAGVSKKARHFVKTAALTLVVGRQNSNSVPAWIYPT
jgi:hypothetical protein